MFQSSTVRSLSLAGILTNLNGKGKITEKEAAIKNFEMRLMSTQMDILITARIYGVTRAPQSREYAIVTEFKNGANLSRINETLLHYWDPVPTNRPMVVELWDYLYEFWKVLNSKYSIIKISEKS
ncbi:unnamed protein product [Rhizophagus irregularis]|nr:unnamed protein product [Rhizophagus irregularis]